jgi:hypothetical protein
MDISHGSSSLFKSNITIIGCECGRDYIPANAESVHEHSAQVHR